MLLALVVAGMVVTAIRIERDLEQRSLEALRAAGAVGVDVSFSGQDGEIRCGVPQADPTALADVVRAVRGVRTVRLSESCAGVVGVVASAPRAELEPADAVASAEPAAPAAPADPTATAVPVAPVAEASVTVPAVVPDPPAAEGTLPPVVTLSVTAVLEDQRMVLSGTVPSPADRAALVAAATEVLGPDAVVDQLQVLPDAAVGVDAVTETLAATTRLVSVAAAHLVSGTVTLDRSSLGVSGVYATAADLTAVRAEADATGAGMQVSQASQQPQQSPAELVTELLNRIVADTPIVFRPGGIELDESAGAVLDRITAVANSYEAVSILVVGHTDATGDDGANQVLSERRALVVAAALIERGIRVPVDAKGRGESEPVLVDGFEDPVASRRVEFVVVDA